MKLGLLWPADGRNDAEFSRWLPQGVDVLIARYDVGGTLDLAQLDADADIDVIANAAQLLRHANLAAVGLGDCAGSFVGGPGVDLQQAQSVFDVLGCPSVTMSTALVEAAKMLELRKVSVLSPYAENVTDRLTEFLHAHDLKVVSSNALDLRNEEAIDAITPLDWVGHAQASFDNNSDGLLIAGGGLCLATVINQLEAVLEKPLICGPGALMWALLKRAGLQPDIPDRGRLFGAAPIPNRRSILKQHLSHATKTYAVSDAPPIFSSGNGSWITTLGCRRLLDFACGSGTTSLGHNHPGIMTAIRTGLDRGLTHAGPHFHTEQHIRLYDLLTSLLPEKLSHFQPATNGSEATEIALKAAMHFMGPRKFLAFDGSYHGRGFGALAVSSIRSRGPNAELAPFSPDAIFLPFGADSAAIAAALDKHGPFAGIIVEPVQATQGMILPPENFLRDLRDAADAADIPLIFDEVFTGFGRTGSMFYFEQAGVSPDLLVLAKAFGGGFPAGLVCGRADILTAWAPGTQSSTFQLHPIAAATAHAMINAIADSDLCATARGIAGFMNQHAKTLLRHACVADVRGIGAMFGVEIVDANGAPDQPSTKAIRREALETGGLITWECGSHGHVIGLVPPLTVSEEELEFALAALDNAITAASG